jgi:long-chain acyl-CoA synthetase
METAIEIFKKKFHNAIKAENFSLPKVDNSDLSALVYTSGTTGFSKGVMLPLQSLTVNVVYAINHFDLKAGDNMLSILPLAHAFGCAFEFLFPFSLGVHTTFLNKTPTPKILLKALADVRPKLFLTVPLIVEKIYKGQIKPLLNKKIVHWIWKSPKINNILKRRIREKLSTAFGGNLMEIVVGGAGLNDEVERFFKKIDFPVTVGYGMTEFGPLISYSGWQTQRLNSVGQIIEYLEVKVDSDDPFLIDGEILIRGENIMTGYYKNEGATEAAIDPGGWMHTGDMGVIDDDNFIYIHGRKKNMILGPSGQNIYPEEIEAKLNNMSFVQETLVLEKEGNLFALVYPDYELVDAKGIPVENLDTVMEDNRKKVNETLPKFSQITKIKLYPKEFEKTPTKKIKRFLYDI